jgi:hypothetical protein
MHVREMRHDCTISIGKSKGKKSYRVFGRKWVALLGIMCEVGDYI